MSKRQRINPASRDTALREAQHAFISGQSSKAHSIASALLDSNKRDVGALHLLGAIALDNWEAKDAANYLNRALKLAPDNPDMLNRLARVKLIQDKFDDAMRCYDKALARNPRHTDALFGKASLLEKKGRIENAYELISTSFSSSKQDGQTVALGIELLGRLNRYEDAVKLAEVHKDNEQLSPIERRNIYAAIGRVHDKESNFDLAFKSLERGNALLPAMFDREAIGKLHDDLIDIFNKEAMKTLPSSGENSTRPIFLVGMPRSGSTLIERILDAHPNVHAGGELVLMPRLLAAMPTILNSDLPYPNCMSAFNEQHAKKLAANYLKELKTVNRHIAHVTDKMLTNYGNVGLISLLFPNARIIHCKRNPLDIGLSCYFNLAPNMQPWITNLEDIGFAYQQYDKVMNHWRNILDKPMLEVPYEELIDSPDNWIREIVSFCDLDWNDACMNYYESKRPIMTYSYNQANKPIYATSVGRHKNYADQLAPLNNIIQTFQNSQD